MSVCPTILVVDDEKNTRQGVRQFLEGKEWDVITAENGEEALKLFISEHPDVVLTDIRMPVMDGTLLLEKILAHDPNAIVILLTAYGSVEDAVRAMKKGAFHYLTKPINLEELGFLINKALNKQHLEEENTDLRQALYRERYEHGAGLCFLPQDAVYLRLC